jgi:hypothetical protein
MGGRVLAGVIEDVEADCRRGGSCAACCRGAELPDLGAVDRDDVVDAAYAMRRLMFAEPLSCRSAVVCLAEAISQPTLRTGLLGDAAGER